MLNMRLSLLPEEDLMTQASRFCGHCGAPLLSDSRFCENCGQPVADAAGPQTGQPTAPVPSQIPVAQPVSYNPAPTQNRFPIIPVAVILIVVILLGSLAYWFFFGRQAGNPEKPGPGILDSATSIQRTDRTTQAKPTDSHAAPTEAAAESEETDIPGIISAGNPELELILGDWDGYIGEFIDNELSEEIDISMTIEPAGGDDLRLVMKNTSVAEDSVDAEPLSIDGTFDGSQIVFDIPGTGLTFEVAFFQDGEDWFGNGFTNTVDGVHYKIVLYRP
jgi:hypothetical protein